MVKDVSHSQVILALLETEPPHSQEQTPLGSAKRLLKKMVFNLLPSFLQSKLRPTSSTSYGIHPTSYLDGLRGVASFIVFMGHYTEENLGWWTEPYGLYENGAPSSPLQLPFIRVIYSARPMVHIFFIISGYVLALKPLKQVHTKQYAALSSTLSSSVFRRGIRLFIPSFITLFVMALTVYYGIADSRYASAFMTLYYQLSDWQETCWRLLWASWAINDISYPAPVYNPALWTIPVEFSQSLLLFIAILGLSRCVTQARLFILAGVMAFCFYSGELYSLEFLGGMFIAEVTILQDRSLLSPTLSPTDLPKFTFDDIPIRCTKASTIKKRLVQGFWIGNVVCGLFIASWTNSHVSGVWGLRVLDAHTPEPYEGQRIWFCLGAFQIVAACTQVRLLQDFFTSPIAQYLGRISYALYLTHNLCLTTLEPHILPVLDSFFSKASFWGRHLSWIVGLGLYLPVVISVADLFWRAVDTPTIKFARWLEEKCIVSSKKL
jgi:peptidoglycan/LPS O-acetylase OafA/YrhL